MASDVLGCQVDVNAGGVDLKFPHHENQMAQAEAQKGATRHALSALPFTRAAPARGGVGGGRWSP